MFNSDKQSPAQLVASMLFQVMITFWFFVWLLNATGGGAGQWNPKCTAAAEALERLEKELHSGG